jgi:hypothetical protein
MQPFQSNRDLSAGRPIAHRRVITFTDGTKIRFGAEETEIGEYGTSITYQPGKMRRTHDQGTSA